MSFCLFFSFSLFFSGSFLLKFDNLIKCLGMSLEGVTRIIRLERGWWGIDHSLVYARHEAKVIPGMHAGGHRIGTSQPSVD